MSVKFSEFVYKRPDINYIIKIFNVLLSEFQNAESAGEQYSKLKEINALRKDFDSMRSIANVRYTINTEDKFYSEEYEYFDNINPVYSGIREKLYRALAESSFRDELEKKTGKELFKIASVYVKTFDDSILEDLKAENHLVTSYIKLIASAKILYEGEDRNLSGMAPFIQSENREVRKSASESKWKFFEDNESEFDRIYDELVKIRTLIAKKLGYKNFIELGYDRMGRTGYSAKEVAGFRDSVKEFIIPVTQTLNKLKKKRIGLDNIYYYDEAFNFRDGNPVPKGSPEWIVEKANKMYKELSEETGSFIKFMIDHDLMDLYNRKGKSAGGYCTYIANHESPFIFSNMNGTSDDIRVLTHEAGHAFQVYESRDFEIMEYIHPTTDACEIHSMGMEFITWPWMQLFFEEDTDKFLHLHLSHALRFIPYGVTVDEFQHFIYENPEATSDERKQMWRNIERKYKPDLDYENNGFLDKGTFWYQQGHIFRRPFYYIDYCLAEICALQFWRKCNHDRNIAWEDYARLCKQGGSKSFLELIEVAKLESPFKRDVVKSIVSYVNEWLLNVNKEFKFAESGTD